MSVGGQRRLRNHSISFRVGGNQFAFTAIPVRQNLRRRRTSQDTGMDQPGKSDMGDMTRRAEDAFKIPDRFGTMARLA